MRLMIDEDGKIFDEDGTIVGMLSREGRTKIVKRTIEFGSEAGPALERVIADVNRGSFKPRALVKRLEQLAEKYTI